jgi:hypothetical protein|tara:strand:+ start:649 stop:855 length:207 start_codon:yes stop_codon:yes gene_type:complete
MVEIQQLIIRAKVNSEFDYTQQELIKVINEQIHDFFSNHDSLSKAERKDLIDECVNSVFDKLDQKIKL